MNNVNFEIKGLKEVMEALKELPIKVTESLFRQFNREAGRKFTQQNLKMAAPINHINHMIITTDRSNKTAVWIGVQSKYYRLRFLERGTDERKTKKGYNRGVMNAKPFVEQAIDSSIDDVIEYTNKLYGERINEFLKKKLKKFR